ncbi:hypothetical protein ACFTZI_20560 [Streptomyces decoyicus]|uniref:hypothetical protein n=1 Tax=Streptomyces decoyicus TaxID=249567 RepID=UPI00362EA8FE
MNLTDLITEAEEALKEHGNISVVVRDPGCGCCASSDYEDAGIFVDTNFRRSSSEPSSSKGTVAPHTAAFVVE